MRLTLLAIFSILFSYNSYSCSKHFESLLDLEKQFPDLNINYNSSHRGWRNYLTKTLHGTRKLVLTFDDGPHPVNTPRLLEILKKYDVKPPFLPWALS